MFSFTFYMIVILVMFVLALPIIFSGVAFSFTADRPAKLKPKEYDNLPPLDRIIALYKSYKNDKDKLKEVLNDFSSTLKTAPDGEKDKWMALVSDFSSNMILMEVDEVGKFRSDLENANPSLKREIAEVVAKALQKRENNKKGR